MYVVTFYSFKGGVGRSMALVNVGAELAKTGRRVLLVDFDLEAPGLSEFGLISSEKETPGIVEFVSDYCTSGEVPNAESYLHLSNRFKETSDRLWVMPAGCQKSASYPELFASINWQDLYEQRHGFLLMEDLRAQWEKIFNFDYVLIDSRTGYTDVAGICTRQLPDAVCLVFIPNKQNLLGLAQIGAGIKAQSRLKDADLRKPLLHYVASNVPNIEDEEQTLNGVLGKFSEELGYTELSAVIYHYNSFALLNEAVFTIDHPTTQLAFQYQALTEEITKNNLRDKKSANTFLINLIKEYSIQYENNHLHEVEDKLKEIKNYFSNDKDILFLLANYYRAIGDLDESKAYLDLAVQAGYSAARIFIQRALLKLNDVERDNDLIWEDVNKALQSEDASVQDLSNAIKLAFIVGRNDIYYLANTPAINNLSNANFISLMQKIKSSRREESLFLALIIIESAFQKRKFSQEERKDLLYIKAIISIAQGDLMQAVELISSITESMSSMRIDEAFNMGMAKYWLGDPDAQIYFSQVLEKISSLSDEEERDLNIVQCLAFAEWVAGTKKTAFALLNQAKLKVSTSSQPSTSIFSCWSYRESTFKQFTKDLNEMEQFMKGGEERPRFLKRDSLLPFTT